jgi:hypothetical protein
MARLAWHWHGNLPVTQVGHVCRQWDIPALRGLVPAPAAGSWAHKSGLLPDFVLDDAC